MAYTTTKGGFLRHFKNCLTDKKVPERRIVFFSYLHAVVSDGGCWEPCEVYAEVAAVGFRIKMSPL